MDINQLRYVLEISNTGSITKAAKKLFMGQPNLSKSIKELENEIGITLFCRSAKGVVLTKSGKAFAGYARSILKQMDTLTNMYKGEAENKDNSLKISSPRASYIAYTVSNFLDRNGCNDKKVIYRETNAHNIINDVENEKVDFGILRYQRQHASYFEKICYDKALSVSPLWNYSMVLLMNKENPLANLREIPYNLLSFYTEIVHGDFTPVNSLDGEENQNLKNSNSIIVFDRGSQIDMLRNIKTSYMWASPVPFEMLYSSDIIEKSCYNVTEYSDVLIRHINKELNETETNFIEFLKDEIKHLCKIFCIENNK